MVQSIILKKADGNFKTVREVEAEYIVVLLNHTGNRKAEVARTLGMTVKTLYNKLHDLGLYDEYMYGEWLNKQAHALMRGEKHGTTGD